MRVALDTNILAYAEGINGDDRRHQAAGVIAGLHTGATVIPVQVLGELFHLLTRKAHRPPSQARDAVLTWQDARQGSQVNGDNCLDGEDVIRSAHRQTGGVHR